MSTYSLDAGDGMIRPLVPWQIGAPWRSDEARLKALAEACKTTPDNTSLTISRKGDELLLALGACLKTVPLPDAARGPDTVLLTMAGPGWSFLERIDRPIERRHIWNLKIALVLLLASCLVPLGLGRITGMIVGIFVVVVSRFQPVSAALCLAVMALLAVLVLAGRLGGRILKMKRGRWGAAVVLALAAVWALAARGSAAPAAVPEKAGCVLVGYSMAEGDGLMGRPGVHELLRQCPACNGSSRRRAKSAETFHCVHDLVCNDPTAFVEGDRLIFLGAANDDLMFAGNQSKAARLGSRLLFFGRDYFQRNPGMDSLNRLVVQASKHALEFKDEQRELLASTMSCARERKVSVYYLHDFLAEDMAQDRNPERQELLRLRREVVESGGGVFVDLQQVFADQAGVAWFSDFIHLSNVGHHKVAEHLAATFQAGGETRPSLPR